MPVRSIFGRACVSAVLVALSVAACCQDAPTVHKIDEILTVEAKRQHADLKNQILTFSEGVKATYDVNEVKADKLVLFMASTELEAPFLLALALANLGSPIPLLPLDDDTRV